jgi:RNA polymerase sigma-70 factor, ECF subfamily
MEKTDDKNLIQRYLKGENKAIDVLIEKYFKQIYSFVYKNVGSQGDAEDITQDVFVRVWKNLKKFDQKRNFKPWIFQIAKNASIDFLRKKKTIPFSRFENEEGKNILLENLVSPGLDILEILNNKRVLASVTAGLNEKDKKIINLRHSDGMSFKEISETLKQSINTTKSRYRRIIIDIKRTTTSQKGV